jgi:MFS family permease
MASIALPHSPATSWSQISLAAVTQNVATGFAFGSFGTLVLPIEAEFHAGRGASSFAISLLIVSLTVTGLVVGRLIERIPIRRVMLAGAAASAAGYGLLSVAQTMTHVLLIYALLLGTGAGMLGVLVSSTHASRWSAPDQRGRAIGVVNMPVLVMVVPLLLAWVLHQHGLRTCFLILAIGDLLTIPLILCIKDRLPDAAEKPVVEVAADNGPSLIARPVFWVLATSIGLMTGAGIMKVAHLVPLLAEQGRSFDQANFLLALSGGTGLVGSLAFGALADRWGAIKALVLNAALQAASWTIFLAPVGMGLLVLDAIVVGACGGGVMAALGSFISAVFGAKSFSRTFGVLGLFTLPFLFGMPPITSWIYSMSGSYWLPVSLIVGCFLASAVMLASLYPTERRARLQMVQP